MPLTTFTTPLNNVEAPLTEAHEVGDGLLVFADTSMFGTPSSSDPIRVCVNFAGQLVIYKITGKTSTFLVINSAIEGTTDISFPADTVVSMDVTAGYVGDAYSAINRLEGIGATFGLPASGGISQSIPYVDPSGNLAQSAGNLSFNPNTNTVIATNLHITGNTQITVPIGTSLSGGTPSGILYYGGSSVLAQDALNFKYDGFSHTLFVDNLTASGTTTFNLGVGTPLVSGTPSGVLYHGGTGLLADDPSFLYDGFSNTLFVDNLVASGNTTFNLALGTPITGSGNAAGGILYENGFGTLATDPSGLNYNGASHTLSVNGPVHGTQFYGDGSHLTGINSAIGVSIGVPIGSGTAGSVLFVASDGTLGQDHTALNWDDSGHILTVNEIDTSLVKMNLTSDINNNRVYASTVATGVAWLNTNRNATDINFALQLAPSQSNLPFQIQNSTGASVFDLNITGSLNLFLGANAGNLTLTGTTNLAIGSLALISLTTGGSNFALGYAALLRTTTGSNNICIGFSNLEGNTTGSNNISIGFNALPSTDSTGNTAIGYNGLYALMTGFYNLGLGYQTGGSNLGGSFNTYVGYLAGANADGYNFSTAVGANTIITASHQVMLGTVAETVVCPGQLQIPTLSDSSANSNTLYFGSDHLDGNGDPKLCRKGPSGSVTIIG